MSAGTGGAKPNGSGGTALPLPAAPMHAQTPAPTGVLYRNALGQTWDGIGECPDWLQRALSADPGLAAAHATLADFYEQVGQLGRAAEHRARARTAPQAGPPPGQRPARQTRAQLA